MQTFKLNAIVSDGSGGFSNQTNGSVSLSTQSVVLSLQFFQNWVCFCWDLRRRKKNAVKSLPIEDFPYGLGFDFVPIALSPRDSLFSLYSIFLFIFYSIQFVSFRFIFKPFFFAFFVVILFLILQFTTYLHPTNKLLPTI